MGSFFSKRESNSEPIQTQETEVTIERTTTTTTYESSTNVDKDTVEVVTEIVSTTEAISTVTIEDNHAASASCEDDSNLQTSTMYIQPDNAPESGTGGEKIELTLEGPLTVKQLQTRAAEKDQIFIVRFPKLENQVVFLDTQNYVLSYRGEAISPYNWSVAMLFETDTSGGSTNKLKWSTLVMSKRYLTVTNTKIIVGKEIGRTLVFEPYPTVSEIPTWTAQGRGTHLTFRNEVDKDQKWFTYPSQQQMVGTKKADNAMHVYHMTNKTAKDIPYINIIP